MKRETVNYTTKEPQHLDGFGGPVTVLYSGLCVNCNSTVYRTDKSESPDPRGFINMFHCASLLVASEYDMIGPDVLACWDCAQEDAGRYERTLCKAKAQWRAKVFVSFDTIATAQPDGAICCNNCGSWTTIKEQKKDGRCPLCRLTGELKS